MYKLDIFMILFKKRAFISSTCIYIFVSYINDHLIFTFSFTNYQDSRVQVSPSPTTKTATSIVPTDVRNNNDLSIG